MSSTDEASPFAQFPKSPMTSATGDDVYMLSGKQSIGEIVPPRSVLTGMGLGVPMGAGVPVGAKSSYVYCYNCKDMCKTIVTKEKSRASHKAAFCLYIMGCCLCYCLPWCIDAFKNHHHKCSKCNAYLGCYTPK